VKKLLTILIFVVFIMTACGESVETFNSSIETSGQTSSVQQVSSVQQFVSSYLPSSSKNTVSSQSVLSSILTVPSQINIKISRNASLIYNNHVGNEWGYSSTINGIELDSNKTYTFKVTDHIYIKSTVMEDDSIPDIGTSSIDIDLSKLDFRKSNSFSTKVIVTENRGRYSGYSAEWELTYTLNRM
jgi:hypothetical protein